MIRLAAVILVALIVMVSAANANCTPAAANNVTATCTGTTTNQGGGAPGTSAGTSGYGAGLETGVTVNVESGATTTLTGSIYGISLGDATVTNNTEASITAVQIGILASSGFSNVTNSGHIIGASTSGIYVQTNATVTNNIGATISGGLYGIYASNGLANVTNSGVITGTANYGIFANTNATVTNSAGASITSGQDGIFASTGSANVINSGTISGASRYGIAGASAMVTNNAAGSITGGQYGIFASSGFANVTNSGRISGASTIGIFAITDASVINNAGATIIGDFYGVYASTGFANVSNSGNIIGTTFYGIAGTNATVINNAGATIGGSNGIYTSGGSANVVNSGSITASGDFGIYAGTNATVTNNAGASITSGTYGIYANAGSSSVFNAGTISGGTAAIRFAGIGNTLTIGAGSIISGNVLGTGSDTFQLGGTDAATFDASTLGAAAQYRGFGTFNKSGSSVWTLTGTSTFAGDVNVNAGTLLVNGSLASASVVLVDPGATLGGSGILAATFLDNGATLAPGTATSIGTLTVNSQLLFCACSLYAVKISGLSADKTQVNGDAFLTDAPVTVTVTGSSIAKRYTILTATNGLTDTFGAVTGAPVGFTPSLSYDANNVYLNYQFMPVLPSNLNRNQQNVAVALTAAASNVFNAGGAIPVAFGAPTRAGLTQMSGETATGSQQTTFDAMNLFMGVLTDPFIAGRSSDVPGAVAFAGQGDATNAFASTGRKRTGSERDAFGMMTKAVPRAPAFEARWNVWAAGFGGSQTTDGNVATGSNTATSRVYGVAAGADYWLSPQTVAGFALAGGGTNFSVANGGSGRSDLFQAGAFVRHTIGSAYITAALAYGGQDITTDRTVTIAGIDQLHANFNANAYSGRVEGGSNRYVIPWTGGVALTPYAAVQVTAFDLPAYAESVVSGANTFALSYGAKTSTATRSELGLRTHKSFVVPDAILTLRGRAAWAHDYNTDRAASAIFQSLPGASFVVNGAAQAYDAALATASAEMKFINGVSLAATFEGEFSNVTRSYAGKGVVRYAW
ncbi:uncharacterized protein with beta-barrel porin domain [Bradyrhizobium sp. AZCC 1588]|uniref:autotransporter outer membrane beta-barrel domain-containing protein n=1 Tax=unclassified Bradyrhizobium TaxID=2631580 RepID=UPI002FF383D5